MEMFRYLLPNIGDLLKLAILTTAAILVVFFVLSMANAYEESVKVNLGIESAEPDPDDPW